MAGPAPSCPYQPCGCCTTNHSTGAAGYAGPIVDCSNQRGHGLSARYVHTCTGGPSIEYPDKPAQLPPCDECRRLRALWNETKSGSYEAFAAMAAYDNHREAVHGEVR